MDVKGREERARIRDDCVDAICAAAPTALQEAVALMRAENFVSARMTDGSLRGADAVRAFEALASNPQRFPMPHAAGRDVPDDPEPWASSGVSDLLDAAGSTRRAVSHMSGVRLRMIARSLLMACRRGARVDADGFRDALVAGGIAPNDAEGAAAPVRTTVAALSPLATRVEKACGEIGAW